MSRIAIYTSARSDYGLLRRFINLSSEIFHVDILVAGAHHLASQGMTKNEIDRDWANDSRVRLISMDFLEEGTSSKGQVQSLARAQVIFGELFASQSYDFLVLLGDRWELFGVSIPAMLAGVPIAHISGGEVTEGVIDDCIRHSHTKLAHLHFVANEQYAQNVSKMGEEDWRITVSGECGLDSIYRKDLATAEEIREQFGLALDQKSILVTFHPATLDLKVPIKLQVSGMLDALEHFPGYQIVFTAPGVESGSDQVVEAIKAFVATHKNTFFVNHFGSRNYLAVLKNSSVVLGNSSSGLVEAPSFGIPTVNIGSRQGSRIAGDSVINTSYDSSEIKKGLAHALSPEFQEFSRKCSNPYDPFLDGRSSERIVAALNNAMKKHTRVELLAKRFDNDVKRIDWNMLLRDFK